jgi:AcrR family transcriptional regulator
MWSGLARRLDTSMRDYDGKTAAERVEERREQLIDAGLEMFGTVGYAGTSIRAVLREAGLRDRYFAESFADLDELLTAVQVRLLDEEVAACRTAIAGTSGGSEAARALVDTVTKMLEKDPRRARIKLHETLAGGPQTHRQRQAVNNTFADLLAQQLPPANKRRKRESDRRMLALGLVAAANELMIAWHDDEQITRKEVVDLSMTIFDALVDRLSQD